MKRKGLENLRSIIESINRYSTNTGMSRRGVDIRIFSFANSLLPAYLGSNPAALILRRRDEAALGGRSDRTNDDYELEVNKLLSERFNLPPDSEVLSRCKFFVVPIDEEAIKKAFHNPAYVTTASSTASSLLEMYPEMPSQDIYPLFNTTRFSEILTIAPATEKFKPISAKKIYINEDVTFESFFVSATFRYAIIRYFFTKALAPVYQSVLNSKYISENEKTALLEGRYMLLDMVDALERDVLDNLDVLNVLKNATDKNEQITIERLSKIINGTSPGNKLNSKILSKTIENGYDLYGKNNKLDEHFTNLGKVVTTMSEFFNENRKSDLRDTVYGDILFKFLEKDQKIDDSDLKEFLAIQAAILLANQTKDMIYTTAKDIQALANLGNDLYALHRIRPSRLDDVIHGSLTYHRLVDLTLIFSDFDSDDFQKFLNKLVARCKAIEPKTEAKAGQALGPFESFVAGIGGAYDTTDVDSDQDNKEIIKILKNLAKEVSIVANVPLKTTPEDTVSFALRKYADDDIKMNEIYDLVDAAVNKCYDVAFGEAGGSEL